MRLPSAALSIFASYVIFPSALILQLMFIPTQLEQTKIVRRLRC